MKYSWEYIKSGRVNIKIAMVFCRGGLELKRFSDCGEAIACQAGHAGEMKNDVRDYIRDQSAGITAHWRNEKFSPKTRFTKDTEWKKNQKKLTDKKNKKNED